MTQHRCEILFDNVYPDVENSELDDDGNATIPLVSMFFDGEDPDTVGYVTVQEPFRIIVDEDDYEMLCDDDE